MNRTAIEEKAWDFLAAIYKHRHRLYPMGVPKARLMLDHEVAARFLGYEIEYAESLGRWSKGNADYQIAGLLDKQRRLIRLATARPFTYETMRFTAAHEVGHIVLEHPGHAIHRDRPVFHIDERSQREPTEQEADYFAACYLAPEKMVTEEFLRRFGIGPPLPLNDDVAFNLCGESGHALMRAGPESRKFAAAVASTERFNGQHFVSLADEFKISVSAMAIRVRELRLIEE